MDWTFFNLKFTLSGPSTSTPIVVGGVKLKELKSRLQSASEGSLGHQTLDSPEKRIAATNCELIQSNPKWFRSRNFLSWDFPSGDSDLLASPLGNIPVCDQERALMEELLYVLMGFDGDCITASPLHSEVDERKCQIDESKLLSAIKYCFKQS